MIDLRLKHRPAEASESRSDNLRIIVELPVTIVFWIDEADRSIFISDLHYVTPGKR
jgi:hypothetical protein